jgi:rod shape-determining protein MreC
MRNLLNFLARYNNLILFLLFEWIAFYLIATGNNYHNTLVVKGVRGTTVAAEREITNLKNYFRLRKINSDLAVENAALRNSIERLVKKENLLFFSVTDTILKQQYDYTSAEIANNSVNRQKNFFTVNKGRKQGIGANMAVISPDGVAGIILGSSDNYSVAMSLLNIDFRLSSRIKSNGYFGSLAWDGRDYMHAVLNEIPQHVTINIGDTVETTTYSAIFPGGIMVGTISEFEKSGSDFYRIKVLLSTDFRKLSHVSIIRNNRKEEQNNLESLHK